MTGARRTYVAVEFPDDHVENVRQEVRNFLGLLPEMVGISPPEFHFVDIYNCQKSWKHVERGSNLKVFDLFADFYRRHRWRVHIQTVDERTLLDDEIEKLGVVDGNDLRERDGQALMIVLLKARQKIPPPPERLTVRIDAGREKPNSPFAMRTFAGWGAGYDGRFAESHAEPLIQIADFLAFSVNRNTHLQMKQDLTETDQWFLNWFSRLSVNSPDIISVSVNPNNIRAEVEWAHSMDRRSKGLE